MKAGTKNINILTVWRRLFAVTKQYPVVVMPFVCIALFDALILILVFLAPRPPFSVILSPVIQAFWGERFLHYPANFLLIPTLFNHTRNVAGFIVGIFFTGIAVSFMYQIERRDTPQWEDAVKRTLKRYIRLAVMWGLTLAVFFMAIKIFKYLTPLIPSRKVFIGLQFLLNVGIQMVIVVAIPAIIIENRKVSAAIIRSLAVFKYHPVTVFLFVLIPGLLLVPATYLHIRLPLLMNKMFPEIALYIMGLRIVILNVIDLLVTLSAVVLLLMHRKYLDRSTSV